MPQGLKKVLYFLGTLDDRDIDWLVRNGVREKIPAQTAIIHEGKNLERIYFTLAGEFSVTSVASKVEIARLTTGEILGEISCLDSRPPSATVTTTQESVVGAVTLEALSRKLERDPAFAARFYKSIAVALADRLRVASVLGLRPRTDRDLSSDEVPPDMLDTLSMAGARFAEMQRRTWGL
jgi:CRP/FNR family transcriptional regulator, cyclic AMP receptor protein